MDKNTCTGNPMRSVKSEMVKPMQEAAKEGFDTYHSTGLCGSTFPREVLATNVAYWAFTS
jgi:hypothetical protein